ncbi:MAG: anti-sigma-F factor Fin family protein [Pelosinus sp.]|nr:anti-sigma-F factor Fin family protein [Pelosinus sp.]
MKICYTCEYCGQPIDTIEVDELDEVKFGFDCLTQVERQDIIKFIPESNEMHVQSLCDDCMAAIGGQEEDTIVYGPRFLH